MREEKWGTEPVRGPERPAGRPMQRGGRPGTDANPIFNPRGGIRTSGNSHHHTHIGLQNDTTIDFVFDYTLSERDILPVIYIFCQDVMKVCQTGAGRVRFGVTFLTDEAESRQWKNKDFTSISTDVLDAMLTHEVIGGGVDSYERLGMAVRTSLEKLSAVPAGERVLMLFTGSCPTDEDMDRVFCRNETPVRSALLFVPAAYSGNEYLFRMVDADGKTDRSKTAFVFNIEDVIKERYLKSPSEKNGRQILDDNQLLKNQLLMALS